jgi:hypothetical protein
MTRSRLVLQMVDNFDDRERARAGWFVLDGCGPGLGERKGKSGVMGDNNLLLIERTELPLTQKWNAWKRPAAGANRANDGLQGQVCASTPRLQVQHSGALDTIYAVCSQGNYL